MEPRYLRQLAEIIDLGSLSLAAKSLHVSQPTLSRNIKSLEALIGAPVLRRGRYGVTPTHIGAALGREGRAIREALRQAELDLGHWKGGLEGRLRIGVGTMLAHSLVPKFLAQIGAARWNVALRIDVEGPDSLIDRVRTRELDLALVQNEPFFSKEGLSHIALFEDKRAYYAGIGHPLAQKKSVSRRDIAKAAHVIVGPPTQSRASGYVRFAEGLGPGLQIEVAGDVSIALHLLSTGTYIAALPQFVMDHLCDERPFLRLAYRGEMPSRMLSIWYKEDMAGQPLIKDFCGRLVKFIGQLRPLNGGEPRRAAVTA